MISQYCQQWVTSNVPNIKLQQSSPATESGEREVWQRCVSWGVNSMPYKIIAVDTSQSHTNQENNQTGKVIGCSYYNDKGFLSALAVLPEYRGKRLGKILVAATLNHMVNGLTINVEDINLHVLGCDASAERHQFYKSCGFRTTNDSRAGKSGGSYAFMDLEG